MYVIYNPLYTCPKVSSFPRPCPFTLLCVCGRGGGVKGVKLETVIWMLKIWCCVYINLFNWGFESKLMLAYNILNNERNVISKLPRVR